MIRFFKNIFTFIWRAWFYFLIGFQIVILFPVLLITISHPKLYTYFYKVARFWATNILYGMGFLPKIKRLQKMIPNKSYILIANHTSMIDIMLMLYVVKNNPFVFVGKKELASIPLFGYFYSRTSILVDRKSLKSKKQVYEQSKECLKRGLSICIFPEGLVPEDESVVLSKFKDGAFKLAVEHQIPIVPMSFLDSKKRFSFTFFSGSPGKLRVNIHPFIETKGLSENDKNIVKQKSFDLIYKDLTTTK